MTAATGRPDKFNRFFQDRLVAADVLKYLQAIPDNRVHCIITSPPYYGLRHYGHEAQIGLEETPQAYIQRLTTVFHEVRRVLHPLGTCWINMGDSWWTGKGKSGQASPQKQQARHDAGDTLSRSYAHIAGKGGTAPKDRPHPTFKPKDMMMMPHRLAIALQDDGWWVRSDIVWHKPNPTPYSGKDRVTLAHEYIFLLSKSKHYYYDHFAVREPSVRPGDTGVFGGQKALQQTIPSEDPRFRNGASQWGRSITNGLYRNRHSVWRISPANYTDAHFAVFPEALVEPMLLAGCPEQVCIRCGSPYTRMIEREQIDAPPFEPYDGKMGGVTDNQFSQKRIQGNMRRLRKAGRNHDNPFPHLTDRGWQATCDCQAETTGGVVLDPFMGSGTTAVVARKYNRHYAGCDLNPDYVDIARKRIQNADPFQSTQMKGQETPLTQKSLWERIP